MIPKSEIEMATEILSAYAESVPNLLSKLGTILVEADDYVELEDQNKYFATTVWSDIDLAGRLLDAGYKDSYENINKLRHNKLLINTLTDCSDGFDAIDTAIRRIGENFLEKQNEND